MASSVAKVARAAFAFRSASACRIIRPLQRVFRFEPGEGCLPLLGDGLRMGERSLVIARVETDQQLSGPDILVVANQDLRNEPGDMRRHRRDIAAGISVIGALDKPPRLPPVPSVTN